MKNYEHKLKSQMHCAKSQKAVLKAVGRIQHSLTKNKMDSGIRRLAIIILLSEATDGCNKKLG